MTILSQPITRNESATGVSCIPLSHTSESRFAFPLLIIIWPCHLTLLRHSCGWIWVPPGKQGPFSLSWPIFEASRTSCDASTVVPSVECGIYPANFEGMGYFFISKKAWRFFRWGQLWRLWRCYLWQHLLALLPRIISVQSPTSLLETLIPAVNPNLLGIWCRLYYRNAWLSWKSAISAQALMANLWATSESPALALLVVIDILFLQSFIRYVRILDRKRIRRHSRLITRKLSGWRNEIVFNILPLQFYSIAFSPWVRRYA